MAQIKITDLQQISSMTDGSALPVDNGIQTYRVTGSQLKTYFAPIYIPPSVQQFFSGSGTYYKSRAFVVSAANATVGATYTHNSVTWTVTQTVASSNIVYMNGNGTPLASGTLTKASGTGDSTIAFTEYRDPVCLNVKAKASGGSGSGSGTSSAGGSAGNNTTFGTSLITCNGGGASFAGSLSTGGLGGIGGTATISSPAYGIVISGGNGQGGGIGAVGMAMAGGQGGGQGGGSGYGATNGVTGSGANANGYGGGGGGAGIFNVNQPNGTGGGEGGGVDAWINNPSLSYAYAVGASVSGGGGAGAGFAGGASGAGIITVFENYQ